MVHEFGVGDGLDSSRGGVGVVGESVTRDITGVAGWSSSWWLEGWLRRCGRRRLELLEEQLLALLSSQVGSCDAQVGELIGQESTFDD